MYAVANQPDHIDKLFNDKGDGSDEFIFYDPVTHEPDPRPVSFADVTDYKGGTDLDEIKERWWVMMIPYG
jgi:hypothetical protein